MCGTPSHTIPQPQPWRVVQVVFGDRSRTHGTAGVNLENVILEVDVVIPYLEQHWGFTNLHRPELHRRLVYKNVPCNPGTGQPCQTASARLRPEELHTAGLRLVQELSTINDQSSPVHCRLSMWTGHKAVINDVIIEEFRLGVHVISDWPLMYSYSS